MRVFVITGTERKPMEMATDEELRSLDRVIIRNNGEEQVLTQSQMRSNVLLLCQKYHLPFSLAVE